MFSLSRRHTSRREVSLAALSFLALALCLGAAAQGQDEIASKVDSRQVDVWSDGTRISGTLWTPQGHSPSDERGAIVMSHGWGGTRDHLNNAYAPWLAAEGFVVLTIDYRGWGDSDSRLVMVEEQPEIAENGEITVKVHAVREVVDPFDQTEDIRNAITFVQGEPGVDPERIGLWGSSYSGGHVIWVAAHDPRVKVTVSQVGSMDSVGTLDTMAGSAEEVEATRIRRVRGELPAWPTQPAAPGLRGTPYWDRITTYSPRDVAHLSQAASLIIDAENEELFDIREHGQAVYAILKNRVPTEYHVIEGIDHYGVYRQGREEALALAIAWFEEHL